MKNWLIIFLLCTSIAGFGQAVSSVVVDRDSVQLGGQFTITYILQNFTAGQAVDLSFNYDSIPNLAYPQDTNLLEEYLDLSFPYSNEISSNMNDKLFQIKDFSVNGGAVRISTPISAFSLGIFEIRPLVVNGEGLNIMNANPSYIKVYPPQELVQDTTGMISDIKPIIVVPTTITDYMPYIISLGAVLLLVLFYLFFRKGKKDTEVEAEVVVIPPHVIALRELQKLRNGTLWQEGRYKDFQFEFTKVLKTYIDERFGLNILESTTSESLQKVDRIDELKSHKEELGKMFRISDLIKFAKATPNNNIGDEFIEKAESFINQTKRIDE